MTIDPAAEPGGAVLPPFEAPPPQPYLPAWLALAQVILASGIPTQVVLVVALILAGVPVMEGGHISLELTATVSLLDTALVALLIRVFLSWSGETSHDVFIGPRRPWKDIVAGICLVPAALLLVGGIVYTLRTVAPWTHSVAESPISAYMDTPIDAAVFFVVAILAGGVREELQRAFILRRFEQRLGGIKVGLALFSLVFAALHYDQGIDAAVGVGTLGLLWGILYIKRRSAVMAMFNHAGFNGFQVVYQAIQRSGGM